MRATIIGGSTGTSIFIDCIVVYEYTLMDLTALA